MRIALFAVLAAFSTVSVSGAGAAGFSSIEYTDFFCGMPIPAAPKPPAASPVLDPINPAGMFATVNVNIVKFSFDPQNPTVYIGDTVRWANIDGSGHTTTSNSNLWNSGTLSNGQNFTFTFTSAGTYPYHCSIHSGMTGSIIVLGSTPTATPTSATNPTLGNYPDTSIMAGGNTTVIPDAAPTLSARMSVSTTTNFKGKLESDPATGSVRVTNAHPAGIYGVRITSFDSGGASVSKTFSLTVTPQACSPATFSPAVNSGVGTSPRSTAIGDFNGDGKQDLAVANQGSNNVSVKLGDGAGGFGAATNFTVGSTPFSVAVGDFNGDGKQDIVAANEISNNVSILLGNGLGSFGTATNFNAGANPTAVAVGELNGDGRPDLAVVHLGSTSVSVLLGNGTGGFGAFTNYSVGVTSYNLVVGDFNNDGKRDLATANTNAGTVSVLLGNGTGGFGSPTNYGVGSAPSSITTGDFNGDGNQDLVTSNYNSNDVSVLIGDVEGVFAAAVNFPAASGTYSVAVGDFNGDGNQDIATANFGAFNLSVLLGNGAASFSSAVNFAAGTQPYSVAVGDFNGDARQDLAAANLSGNDVSILLSTCSASLTPTPTNTATASNTPTPTATETFTPTDTPTATLTATDTPTNTPTPSAAISGIVTYGNAIGAPNSRFVSNVLLNAEGSPNVSAASNFPGGAYTLTGFGAGSYTITPAKTTGQNSITSFDAARIAQHAAGVVLLTGNQLIVADVSNNGSISSFDAGFIGKYVVGAPPFGIAGNWVFSPASKTYPSVNSSLEGENYTGFLMGDVSGNWANNGARPGGRVASREWRVESEGSIETEKPITVTVQDVATAADREIVVPVNVRGAADKGIISYEFDLRYDPALIQPMENSVDVAGTASRGLSVVTNAAEPGLLRVVVYGAMPIDSDGVLLNLRFTAVGKPGSVSPLTWDRFILNEGLPMTATDAHVVLF